MTPRRLVIAATAALIGSVALASAKTLDFNELTHGLQFGPSDTILTKTISGARLGFRSPGNLYAFNTGVAGVDGGVVSSPQGGICATGASDDACTGHLRMIFLDRPIENLSFDVTFADAGDRAVVLAVLGDGTRVRQSINAQAGGTTVDFAGVTDIDALVINASRSSGGGYVYTNVSFQTVPGGGSSPSPIPLPAGLPLLLVGLAGFTALRERGFATKWRDRYENETNAQLATGSAAT